MATDRLSEALEHVRQLSSLCRLPRAPADNQAQQGVALNTTYTRTEPPSCDLPPNEHNNAVQPQTQLLAVQGDDQSTTMSARPHTSLAPNQTLAQMKTEIDTKTPRVPNQEAIGLQTEIDANAQEQRQGEQTSHDNNSSVPRSKPLIRPSILNAENLPRMRESVPKEQEGQQAGAKKDITDIFGLGGTRGRSNSPHQWYKNELVRPIPRKPEVTVQVLLPPRQLAISCESLAQGSLGGGDADVPTDKK